MPRFAGYWGSASQPSFWLWERRAGCSWGLSRARPPPERLSAGYGAPPALPLKIGIVALCPRPAAFRALHNKKPTSCLCDGLRENRLRKIRRGPALKLLGYAGCFAGVHAALWGRAAEQGRLVACGPQCGPSPGLPLKIVFLSSARVRRLSREAHVCPYTHRSARKPHRVCVPDLPWQRTKILILRRVESSVSPLPASGAVRAFFGEGRPFRF